MFEIHVLIEPTEEEQLNDKIDLVRKMFPLLHSCKDMATLTSTGEYPRQPMVSGFTSTDDRQVAVSLALGVAGYLFDNNIHVVRVKVEKLITLDPDAVDEEYSNVTGDNYYEAHIKIGKSIPDPSTYASLARICLKYGAQLLFNPYSPKMAPVTTMRMYDTDLCTFKVQHEALVADLEVADFLLIKQHIEYGVYDSNVYTDEGWLFMGTNYKTPITDVDCSLRLCVPPSLNI
jgi:hypothetical protein